VIFRNLLEMLSGCPDLYAITPAPD